MKGFAGLLIAVVVAFYLGIQAVGGLLAMQPEYVYIDEATVFVYPDQGQIVLVAPVQEGKLSGEYLVEGSAVVSGCYHLGQPEEGVARGMARMVWPVCGGER